MLQKIIADFRAATILVSLDFGSEASEISWLYVVEFKCQIEDVFGKLKHGIRTIKIPSQADFRGPNCWIGTFPQLSVEANRLSKASVLKEWPIHVVTPLQIPKESPRLIFSLNEFVGGIEEASSFYVKLKLWVNVRSRKWMLCWSSALRVLGSMSIWLIFVILTVHGSFSMSMVYFICLNKGKSISFS